MSLSNHQFPLEHRMSMLEAVRRASHTMGAHHESFGEFDLRGNRLTFSGRHGSDPDTFKSRHEFDLSSGSPVYLSVTTIHRGGEYSFSPEAQARVHGKRQLYREGVWKQENI